VWFYEERAHLIEKVADFAAEGLRCGDHVVLVATSDHLADIERRLVALGVNTLGLATYDAAAMLDTFYRDGTIDRDAFNRTVGGLVRATSRDRRLRVFGEMVALLWADGAVQAAVQLEALWCQQREHASFQLLCAYPSSVLLEEQLHAPVNAVCELHSEIHLGEAGEPTTSMRTYPATPQAVGEARRFVRACLGGGSTGIEDVLLVTSELACNAVRHAQSAFAVSVTVLGDALRISVRDASGESPRLLPLPGDAESGRGIATIAALSSRWGIESHRGSKTVWAELPLAPVSCGR
jgi:anti-sigma regulatory factor (Ser/Thr protein kinase)